MKAIEVERQINQSIKNTFRYFGHDDLSSSIITTLFLSTEEMSMETLSKKTGYSLPSISLKMKQLLQHPAIGITRTSKPGSRKAYFLMEKDIIGLNIRRMEILHDKMILGLYRTLSGMSKDYKKAAKTEDEKAKSKVIDQYIKDLGAMEEAFCVFEKKLRELDQKRKNK